MTFSMTTLSIIIFSIKGLFVTVSIKRSVSVQSECRYAECHDLLSVMLNVTMLSVIMLNVVMQSVVMLNVVAQVL
jgi:hypothetical protein